LGPFATVADYCQDLPDWSSIEDAGHMKRTCREATSAWHGKLRGTGPVQELRLLTVQGEDSSLEKSWQECQLGLHTSKGWYFLADAGSCEEDFSGTQRATRIRKLSWASSGENQILMIDIRAIEDHSCEDHSPPPPQPSPPPSVSGGNALVEPEPTPPPPAPPADDPAGVSTEKVADPYEAWPWERRLALCGVGPSQIPSCTSWIGVGCFNPDKTSTHKVRFKDGVLTLARRQPAGEEEEENVYCNAPGSKLRRLRVTFP
jgi:hypothetical protein